MSTSIRKLRPELLQAKLKRFRKLLRLVTSDIVVMLKFGCIASRDLNNGSKECFGLRGVIVSLVIVLLSLGSFIGKLGSFHRGGHPKIKCETSV
jgi:hypothetical protein